MVLGRQKQVVFPSYIVYLTDAITAPPPARLGTPAWQYCPRVAPLGTGGRCPFSPPPHRGTAGPTALPPPPHRPVTPPVLPPAACAGRGAAQGAPPASLCRRRRCRGEWLLHNPTVPVASTLSSREGSGAPSPAFSHRRISPRPLPVPALTLLPRPQRPRASSPPGGRPAAGCDRGSEALRPAAPSPSPLPPAPGPSSCH